MKFLFVKAALLATLLISSSPSLAGGGGGQGFQHVNRSLGRYRVKNLKVVGQAEAFERDARFTADLWKALQDEQLVMELWGGNYMEMNVRNQQHPEFLRELVDRLKEVDGDQHSDFVFRLNFHHQANGNRYFEFTYPKIQQTPIMKVAGSNGLSGVLERSTWSAWDPKKPYRVYLVSMKLASGQNGLLRSQVCQSYLAQTGKVSSHQEIMLELELEALL